MGPSSIEPLVSIKTATCSFNCVHLKMVEKLTILKNKVFKNSKRSQNSPIDRKVENISNSGGSHGLLGMRNSGHDQKERRVFGVSLHVISLSCFPFISSPTIYNFSSSFPFLYNQHDFLYVYKVIPHTSRRDSSEVCPPRFLFVVTRNIACDTVVWKKNKTINCYTLTMYIFTKTS